jgi:glutathione S-transferase
MNEALILHHYDSSPYSEKIRLMFGLTNMSWLSLLSPVWPPRPNVEPLAGGYRRIPVAQIGADVFCDSALIAWEVARITQNPALDPANVDPGARGLMEQAETEAFFAAIAAVPPLRLLGTMLRLFGPVGMYRFAKDRSGLLRGGTARPPEGAGAKKVLQSLLDALEARLAECQWVGGDNASVADFAAYHPLWLHVSCSRRPLEAGPNTRRWYERVGKLGHGRRQDISQGEAFTTARNADPRPLPASVEDAPLAIGTAVKVAPRDYGVVPVAGSLAAVTGDRVIIRRDTPDFGVLHVHFPRAGYSLEAAGAA